MGRRILCLCVLAAFGCGDDGGDGSADDMAVAPDMPRDYEPEPFEPTDATRAYCPAGDVDGIEARISEILRTLSVAEKVALMHGERVGLVDGVWRVEGNDRVELPGLGMLDGPRGLSSFSGKAGTAFPVAILRGAAWDPALEERIGAAMGRELASAGADVLLAPTINLVTHPRWGRSQETYSEDTHHMGAMGVAFIRGVQSEGVMASAKHYAANNIDDTRHEVDVRVDERTLREVYLPQFRRAVRDAQVASVMSAYNSINGDWADQNTHLLRDILKGEWEFQGFVESDWLLGTHGGGQSVRAGLDIEMPARNRFVTLPREVANGELEERFLDDAVRRIARAQLCYGLEAHGPVDDPSARETEAHLALAREAARRGIVLLQNETVRGQPALPLDVADTVVLTGPLAEVDNIGDEGSSSVTPTEVVNALEGLSAVGAVTLVADPSADPDAISAADAVVVVVGLVAEDEGEASVGAGDRESLALPLDQAALIAEVAGLSDRVIVVLEGSGPLLVAELLGDIEGLVWAGYPGSRGGEALADVLYGAHAPSGRLPVSWPRAEADLPPFDNVSDSVTYGYLHGYRHLAAEGTDPLFGFGFGLSYVSFRYDAIRVSAAEIGEGETVNVEVDVTNEGDVDAFTTVQLYVAMPGSAVTRAPYDLRAFATVEVAAGATVTATMTLDARDLAYWDEGWTLEPGDVALQVGPSSLERPLEATLTVR